MKADRLPGMFLLPFILSTFAGCGYLPLHNETVASTHNPAITKKSEEHGVISATAEVIGISNEALIDPSNPREIHNALVDNSDSGRWTADVYNSGRRWSDISSGLGSEVQHELLKYFPLMAVTEYYGSDRAFVNNHYRNTASVIMAYRFGTKTATSASIAAPFASGRIIPEPSMPLAKKPASRDSLFAFFVGKFGFMTATVPTGTLAGTIRLKGVNIDVIGIIPVSDRFSVFGRAGMNYLKVRDSMTGNGLVNTFNPDPVKETKVYKFGLGIQYDFTKSFSIRTEGERYQIGKAVGRIGYIDMVSIGVVYQFSGE